MAWVAERKDLLSTLFALLALLHYASFAKDQKRASFWLSLLFFSLGLLAKPMIVTLPFIFLLLDFWPLKRMSFDNPNTAPSAISKPAWLKVVLMIPEKWPFFLLAAISCVLTIGAQKSGGAIMSLARIPLADRLANAPVAVVSYLGKFFWPSDLCAIYMLHHNPIWEVVLSLAVLLLIFLAAWRLQRRKPYFIVGWLWFVGALVPVSGLVQVGIQSMADRYTYLPSIGLFLALVFMAADFLAELQTPKAICVALGLLILSACIRVTEYQLAFWRDSETLFRRAVAVTTDNPVALVDLGVALDAQGRLDEALVIYRQAEKLDNGYYFQLHNNLGNILGILGKHQESLAEYRIALCEQPNDPTLHNAAGNQLVAIRNYDEAMAEFSKAQKLNPSYVQPHLGLAGVLLKTGQDAGALNELRQAAHLAPDNVQILALSAHILASSEDPAARDGRTALMLAFKANDLTGHTQPMIFDVMGMACAELGDFTNAQACAQTALKLGNDLGMKNLASIRGRLERYKNHQPWRESFLDSESKARD